MTGVKEENQEAIPEIVEEVEIVEAAERIHQTSIDAHAPEAITDIETRDEVATAKAQRTEEAMAVVETGVKEKDAVIAEIVDTKMKEKN